MIIGLRRMMIAPSANDSFRFAKNEGEFPPRRKFAFFILIENFRLRKFTFN